MTADEFFQHVRADLRLRHVPFDARQLEEFCRTMLPIADDDDNWAWWGDTFLEAMGSEPGMRQMGQHEAQALYWPGAN